jgi:16S rRNA processing protein RimM
MTSDDDVKMTRQPRADFQSETGSDANRTEPRFLMIGQVARPHGVQGEVSVTIMTEFPERFDAMETVYVGNDDTVELLEVVSSRWSGERALLRFAGVHDRNDADKLRGLYLQIPVEEAMTLEEDAYYIYQLVGLSLVTDEGQPLGTLIEVIETGANDVYVVRGDQGEILIPAINDVVLEVDLEAGLMTVHLIEGLQS